MVKGSVSSKKGFYVGDICYVLGDAVYYGVWGKEYNYRDGVHEVPENGFRFAVAGTAYGDGSYCDGEGNEYGVDAGVIGLVPMELIEKEDGLRLGRVFLVEGEAEFEADDGVFLVTIPGHGNVVINTRDFEGEEDDDWWEDEEEDDEIGFDPYLGCYTYDV